MPQDKASEPKAQVQSSELQELRELLNAQAQEIKVLRNMQDPTDLAREQRKANPDAHEKEVRLTQVYGKIVTRWDDMVKNESRRDESGKFITEQILHIYYKDGTDQELPLKVYSENRQLTAFYPVTETMTNKEGVFFTVRLPDGELVTVEQTFLN